MDLTGGWTDVDREIETIRFLVAQQLQAARSERRAGRSDAGLLLRRLLRRDADLRERVAGPAIRPAG